MNRFLSKPWRALSLLACCAGAGFAAGCGDGTAAPKKEPGSVGSIPPGPATELQNKLGGVTGPGAATAPQGGGMPGMPMAPK